MRTAAPAPSSERSTSRRWAIVSGSARQRQFTPGVLRTLDFTGGNNAQPLIAALGILRQLLE